MSLRRRIAGAAALAVAAVAVTVSVTGYLSTRSHLLDEVRHELSGREAQYFQQFQRNGGQPSGPPHNGGGGYGPPPGPGYGGAAGEFQFVHADGTVFSGPGLATDLPRGARVVDLARSGTGSFFTSTTIDGHHLEILTFADASHHWAVEVALPLNDVDSVLSGLLLPYGLLIGGGILLAGLLGAAISRSALRPIERFVGQTERVTSSLENPVRLEEAGPSELGRLAASFNQTLDALERSIEAQRQLVADASHELRTPIAALRSNIQIFLDAERLPDEEREGLQQSILAELDELTQVVADVLELARGSAPGRRFEELELDVLAREAVERAQRRAPGLEFELELEPTVITGDPDRLSRAITNVVDNARKWSPPDGRVEIALHAATLTVRDHGPGFDERDLPHVFDRFYRAGRARRLPGSGLGLAIVKQAAQAHGGSAQAANAPGGGAIVTVRFGPDAAPGAATDASARASRHHVGPGARGN